MYQEATSTEELIQENQHLLDELASAYQNMEMIMEQAAREKQIAYQELQYKYVSLEKLYGELSNRENMLVHMEKLSSIGQFITEIIHELNNPLTVILGTVELVQMMDLQDPLRKDIKAISRETSRMLTYLTRFRNMAYKDQETFVAFDVNQNLKDCLETLEIIRPKSVKVEAKLSTEDLIIKGDPYQISQIYLNLAKNAIDVLKRSGGTISFSTSAVDRKWILESGKFGKDYCQEPANWEELLTSFSDFVLVEVKDNGCGIPGNLLPNIFKAFFTTKPRDKGTGLGLSISGDIAIRHKGNLAVKSTDGIGTKFQLLIPRSGM